MQLLSLALSFLLPAAVPGPQPSTYAGPVGRVPLHSWTYAADPADTGLAAGWADGRFAGAHVRVPHVANPAQPGTPGAQVAFRGSTGWYRTTIRVGGGRYVLRFESVASRAQVFVDGREVAAHTRAYEPFEAGVRLSHGRHRVVVRADWRSPASQDAEGLHRTWFNWGGMDREVTLRKVGASEVTGVAAVTHLARGRGGARVARVSVTARVRNAADTARVVPVEARLGRRAGQGRLVELGRVRLAPGQARDVERTLTVRHPDLWSPGHGALYSLVVGVPFEDAYRARIGLREVAVRDGVLRINGRRTVLRGASIQEDAPGRGDALRPADMDAIVARLRAIGANATRAQHPLSPALLERLDRAGIAVWQQIGPVDSPAQFLSGASPQLMARAREDVRADLRAARLHPAIVGWSLGCEVAGNGAPGQAEYVDGAARELHAADPGRPVGVDIWTDHLPQQPGLLYRSLDAVGFTSYLGWYERTNGSSAEIRRLLLGRVARMRERFPGRAVLVAELGAEADPRNPPDAHGGVGYQALLLATELRALRTAPGLSGAFVWLLRDFAYNPAFGGGTILHRVPGIKLVRGLNQKGLYTYAGRPRPAARAVARELRAFPG